MSKDARTKTNYNGYVWLILKHFKLKLSVKMEKFFGGVMPFETIGDIQEHAHKPPSSSPAPLLGYNVGAGHVTSTTIRKTVGLKKIPATALSNVLTEKF